MGEEGPTDSWRPLPQKKTNGSRYSHSFYSGDGSASNASLSSSEHLHWLTSHYTTYDKGTVPPPTRGNTSPPLPKTVEFLLVRKGPSTSSPETRHTCPTLLRHVGPHSSTRFPTENPLPSSSPCYHPLPQSLYQRGIGYRHPGIGDPGVDFWYGFSLFLLDTFLEVNK